MFRYSQLTDSTRIRIEGFHGFFPMMIESFPAGTEWTVSKPALETSSMISASLMIGGPSFPSIRPPRVFSTIDSLRAGLRILRNSPRTLDRDPTSWKTCTRSMPSTLPSGRSIRVPSLWISPISTRFSFHIHGRPFEHAWRNINPKRLSCNSCKRNRKVPRPAPKIHNHIVRADLKFRDEILWWVKAPPQWIVQHECEPFRKTFVSHSHVSSRHFLAAIFHLIRRRIK